MSRQTAEALDVQFFDDSSECSLYPPEFVSCPYLSCEFEYPRPTLCYASVIAAPAVVDAMYEQTALSQQRTAQTFGFNRGEIPLEYIKQNFKEHLTSHLQEFLFKYCVVSFLYDQIRIKKIVIGGDPRLSDVQLARGQEARFRFELTVVPNITIYEWKYFPFKAPRRKNYKDLDRQVESFLEEERVKQIAYEQSDNQGVAFGDWVNFDLAVVDSQKNSLEANQKQNFWFKIGGDEGENPLRDAFLDKKLHESFCTTNEGFQTYFSSSIATDYNFLVAITDIVPHRFFCFEQFKRHFRIKTNKDMHQKLIEVFSYRNDISQRRAMVEEALKLITSKHPLEIPNHLILRQQKAVLEAVQENPDYHVYRVQKDFQQRIRQLAEKQSKELLLIDQLAYHENLAISDQDVRGYLNLTNRQRTKEFIYFGLPSFKASEQEVPAPSAIIRRTCLREKTINHVIYHLTKK